MRRAAVAVLWGSIPALACLLVGGYVALAVVRGVNPPAVPVVGTSMNPLLHAGDLVFLRHADPAKLRKGEIIAFKTTADARKRYGLPGSYVHRIVKISKGVHGYEFRTKGDNVQGPDPVSTIQQNVIGVYAGKAAGFGYPVLFFRSRQGVILLAAAVLIGLLYVLLGFFERRADERLDQEIALTALVREAQALNVTGIVAGVDEAVTTSRESREATRELAGAVREYGEHLRSHTSVMMSLAASTAELHAAASALRAEVTTVPQQPTEVERHLARVAEQLETRSRALSDLRRSLEP